jgi:TonB family protein
MSRKSMRMIVPQLFAVMLALLAGICGNDASAQGENQSKKPGGGVFVGSGANIVAVKNVPFSGEMVCESIPAPGYGSTRQSKSATMYYRDGAGRIRREVFFEIDGKVIEHKIEVIDHFGGQNFTLDPRNRTVKKSSSPIRSLAEIPYASQTLIFQCGIGNSILISRDGYASPGVKIESLGARVIEGVEAEGTRFSLTIAVGKVNNEEPIVISYERWYSRELQLDVLIKMSSTAGIVTKSTGRVINIKRGEPDAALFEIPPDYTDLALKPPSSLKSPIGVIGDPETSGGIGRSARKTPPRPVASGDQDAGGVYPMTASLMPTILYREAAKYTEDARNNRIEGVVVLSVVFTLRGSITNIRVIRGLPHGLTEKAIEAAHKIRFNPAVKDGAPVNVRGSLEFSFKL